MNRTIPIKQLSVMADGKHVYFSEGELVAVASFKDGKLHGFQATYYEDRSSVKCRYEDGIAGEEIWHDKGGEDIAPLDKEPNFDKIPGKGDLDTKFYRLDGTLRAISRMKNNKMHGFQEDYYENGKIRVKINYEDGVAHGEEILYDKEGKVKSRKINDREGVEVPSSVDPREPIRYTEWKGSKEEPLSYEEWMELRRQGIQPTTSNRVHLKKGVCTIQFEGEEPKEISKEKYDIIKILLGEDKNGK